MTAALIPHPAASRHAFRAQVCRLVDRLITMLDEIDGDPDLEDPGDLEPSLSFTAHMNQDLAIRGEPMGWAAERGEIDLEEACEDEGAITGDDESDTSEADRSWPETGEGPQ